MEFTIEEIQSALDGINRKSNVIIDDSQNGGSIRKNIGTRRYEELIDEVILDINYLLIGDMMKFADKEYPKVHPQLEDARRKMWTFKWLLNHEVHGVDLGQPYKEKTGSIWADDNVGSLRVKTGTVV